MNGISRGQLFRIAILVAVLILCLLLFKYGKHKQGVSIPLPSILSTSGQGELQPATTGYQMIDGEKQYVVETGAELQQFYDATKQIGASNLFLVDALNASAAIRVSKSVFAGYRSANVPATLNEPNPPRGKHWLVVYLGIAGSDPVRWIVDDVLVEQGNVRFSYHRNSSGISTNDIHHYYYWVPLGKLDDGYYKLELYDTEAKAVTLMRRVEVTADRFKR